MKLSLGLTPRDYSVAGGAVAYDADAQAYFTANTTITSTADKNAINTFYLGLKSDSVYTKIKAMYLPIWGSAASSKWNLVNPADTNAAFRLTFATGFTYANTGVTGNGTSAYANTFLTPATALTLNQSHMSFYCRTNTLPSGTQIFGGSIKGVSFNGLNTFFLGCTNTGLLFAVQNAQVNTTDYASYTDTSTRGFFINNRTSTTATTLKLFKNGVSKANATTSPAGQQLSSFNQYLWAAYNDNVTSPFAELYANREFCFMSIGNGLTDTEATNFSNRVNTLLAYFGINTYPVVSDADAQAYINANEAITNQSDANAINTFFTGLKSDGVYSKIKAMYLPIWGSAASSKWNLVNPVDTDAAFRLTFATGVTFTSSGMTGNGTSGYANTNLLASVVNTTNHLSFYSRTQAVNTQIEMGVYIADGSAIVNQLRLASNYTAGNADTGTGLVNFTTTTDARGFWIGTKRASNDRECYLNGVSQATSTTSDANNLPNGNIYILARNQISPNGVFFYSTKQCSFSSIGNGLTDTEATNFYTRVNTLMTYFGINV